MLAHKRRPTSSHKSSQRSKIESNSIISSIRRTPVISQLVLKKYYLPAIQEEQRHLAFLISKFVAGYHNQDDLMLGELTRYYSQREWLGKVYEKPQILLKKTVTAALLIEANNNMILARPILHFGAFTFRLLADNQRRKKQWASKRSFTKKDSLRTTQSGSRKQINVLGNHSLINKKQPEPLNESHELSRLSKCLRNVLRKHDIKKSYKAFLLQMEKRDAGRVSEKSEGMMKLILNLEKDFSSIHQESGDHDFSKESIYGLSDLKKKSDKNSSKIDVNKNKDKRLSANFLIGRIDFNKKLKDPKDVEKSNKGNSASKNSRKSSSLRNKKCSTNVSSTPDNHAQKSKSKSTKKVLLTLKSGTEKKSKLTDTQRLYYDQTPERVQQKQESKCSLLRQGVRKAEGDGAKSKKKLLRR